ncbi:sorting nexin-12 [Crotalus adamanteus]|uniref:Sorting nexin-12 n=1 Tax=Crotalus adamanteus TaxID=8729 RepID=A0AAW1CC50_CROAD
MIENVSFGLSWSGSFGGLVGAPACLPAARRGPSPAGAHKRGSAFPKRCWGKARRGCRLQQAPLSAQTNLPIFKLKESCVRQRYSDFELLKNELERDSKIVVPPFPGKALKCQLPFRGDEGIFEESFIEERRQGLEQFINK